MKLHKLNMLGKIIQASFRQLQPVFRLTRHTAYCRTANHEVTSIPGPRTILLTCIIGLEANVEWPEAVKAVKLIAVAVLRD